MRLFGRESIETRPLSELEENRRAERFAAQDNMISRLEGQFPGMSLGDQMEMNQSMAKSPYDQQPMQPEELVMQQMVGDSNEFVQAA
jgi:hypothetical protein